MIGGRAARIAAGDFVPSFELTMARKDVRLMIEEAQRHGVQLGVMPAIAAVYDDAIARGLRRAGLERHRPARRPLVIRYITEADVEATLDVATSIELLDSAARALAAGTRGGRDAPARQPAAA